MNSLTTLVYVTAKNDANGNPRRGWACYLTANGALHDFYPEGYQGTNALPIHHRAKAARAPRLQVTVAEYKRLAAAQFPRPL